jgi:predicted ferric reductase
MNRSDAPAPDPLDDLQPAVALQTLLLMLLAIAVGTLMAAFVLPTWLPGLSDSLLGPAPKVYWYLSRASGEVSVVLLWLSMAIGVMITNKMARVWPGGPTAFELHQHASLLGLGFALFHGLILLGDQYAKFSLTQLLLPFGTTTYRPLWVGMGQIGFYLMGLVTLTFYVRKTIGPKVWRSIHILSYLVFLMGIAHGLQSGTDSTNVWVQGLYSFLVGSLLFLTIYRILIARFPVARKPRSAPAASGLAQERVRRS